jgi:hypothetical protein
MPDNEARRGLTSGNLSDSVRNRFLEPVPQKRLAIPVTRLLLAPTRCRYVFPTAPNRARSGRYTTPEEGPA